MFMAGSTRWSPKGVCIFVSFSRFKLFSRHKEEKPYLMSANVYHDPLKYQAVLSESYGGPGGTSRIDESEKELRNAFCF